LFEILLVVEVAAPFAELRGHIRLTVELNQIRERIRELRHVVIAESERFEPSGADEVGEPPRRTVERVDLVVLVPPDRGEAGFRLLHGTSLTSTLIPVSSSNRSMFVSVPGSNSSDPEL